MKLSDIVKSYRKKHRMSLRTFAERCDISHTVIDHIEKEVNQIGTPYQPSLDTLQKVANGMRMSLNDLLNQMDDVPVYVDEVDEMRDMLKENDDLRMLLSASSKLSPDDIKQLYRIASLMGKDAPTE